jgi:hypothetical protein
MDLIIVLSLVMGLYGAYLIKQFLDYRFPTKLEHMGNEKNR